MQGFILTATEKFTLVVDSTQILTKLMEREMKVKGSDSWCMLEEYFVDTYYMQGFILIAITAAVKCTLVLDWT